MYISKIDIENFRNFKNKEIEFNDGVNVIIGHNNAGKSNLIKALALVLDFQGTKRKTVKHALAQRSTAGKLYTFLVI